ncbi:hypothetical protein Corgl_1264 [Coriobacterium glomerans PW2]|uniref:Uncharacterized protein n=1 Tax=Coriobacterium glomerans (strain ATCC 49209 / DSM 20642 / JCM 10262 / PW2) TaxID=700015 RepID=F2N8I2_CORGP|nr:hypothetical protein [Coriobacterium glomerans]AEB07365.1 hypothetical protein Corgl_1264 [Coriobacterium glomerans PW2]
MRDLRIPVRAEGLSRRDLGRRHRDYCYALEQTGLNRNTTLTKLGNKAFSNRAATDSSKVPVSALSTTGLESNRTSLGAAADACSRALFDYNQGVK